MCLQQRFENTNDRGPSRFVYVDIEQFFTQQTLKEPRKRVIRRFGSEVFTAKVIWSPIVLSWGGGEKAVC